jgi:hypothetical protein
VKKRLIEVALPLEAINKASARSFRRSAGLVSLGPGKSPGKLPGKSSRKSV